MAASVQGDYKKTAHMQCGRAVYERLGGTALWFVKDCEGEEELEEEGSFRFTILSAKMPFVHAFVIPSHRLPRVSEIP